MKMTDEAMLGWCNSFRVDHDRLVAALSKHFIGRDVLLKSGMYAGRRARVASVMFDGGRTRLLAHPYRRAGHGHMLLYDKPDARTYWSLDKVELLGSNR